MGASGAQRVLKQPQSPLVVPISLAAHMWGVSLHPPCVGHTYHRTIRGLRSEQENLLRP